MYMNKKIIFTAIFSFFFSFHLTNAKIVINEIMYDLEGTDTDREWIEIYNDGNETIDLSTYKLFESSTNHGLTLGEGDKNIPANGYAILSSNKTKFKTDYPNFNGTIFDTSFSLNNDGEALSIKDANLNVVDNYTYSSSLGANGDGKSLQKINNVWKTGMPTPGALNQSDNISENTNTTTGGGGAPALSSSTQTPKIIEVPIKTNIFSKEVGFVGVPLSFNANTTGRFKEKLYNGRYFWNFGDGDFKEVKLTDSKEFTHTFFYPGEYNVSLFYYSDIYADNPESVDDITIKIVGAELIISEVGNQNDFFIKITNNTSYDANIGGWILQSGEKRFVFPKNTIVFSKKDLIISPKISQFVFSDRDNLKLLNSNWEVISDYFLLQKQIIPKGEIKTTFSNIKKTTNATNFISNNNFFKDDERKNDINIQEMNLEEEVLNAQDLKENTEDYLNDPLFKNELKGQANGAISLKNTYIYYIIFVFLLVISSFGIYKIKKRKNTQNIGEGFEILE